MLVRTNFVANLTSNDEITTNLYVRLYKEEGQTLSDDEFLARILIAYAKFRKCPLKLIGNGEEITPEEYLEKLKEHDFYTYHVEAEVAVNNSICVNYVKQVESEEVWRTLRRHVSSEGTVEVRI